MTKPALVVDHLVLRTAIEEAEIGHLRQALNQGYYLKAGRPAGHVLWQGIYRTDTEADCPELVAVFCWGGAAKRLNLFGVRSIHRNIFSSISGHLGSVTPCGIPHVGATA